MTTDLWMLVGSALLYFAIMFLYSFGRFVTPGGFQWAFGNRGSDLEVAPWVARAGRAQQNLSENNGPFANMVHGAEAAGKANHLTALGATLFLAARVVHTGLYVGGVSYLRSLAWAVALTGEVLIFVRIFQ